MKHRQLICFLGAFVLAMAWAAVAGEPQPQPLDVKLNILTGQVKLTRVGKTLSDVLTSGQPLFAGDLIETLRESKAELTYPDGTTMRIKALTLIEVQPVSLKVFKGKSWFKFAKRGTEFVIETPSLVAGIRGTVFDVAVTSRGKSCVSVVEGAVEVSGKAKPAQKLLIRKGFATHCETGATPVPAYGFNVAKKTAEWKETEWAPSDTRDPRQLYIKYMILRGEYGADDSRTLDAFKEFEAAQQKKPDPKK